MLKPSPTGRRRRQLQPGSAQGFAHASAAPHPGHGAGGADALGCCSGCGSCGWCAAAAVPGCAHASAAAGCASDSCCGAVACAACCGSGSSLGAPQPAAAAAAARRAVGRAAAAATDSGCRPQAQPSASPAGAAVLPADRARLPSPLPAAWGGYAPPRGGAGPTGMLACCRLLLRVPVPLDVDTAPCDRTCGQAWIGACSEKRRVARPKAIASYGRWQRQQKQQPKQTHARGYGEGRAGKAAQFVPKVRSMLMQKGLQSLGRAAAQCTAPAAAPTVAASAGGCCHHGGRAAAGGGPRRLAGSRCCRAG